MPRRASLGLLAGVVVQIAVGLAQARLGLPVILVGVHMVLACVLVAVMTAVLLALRAPRAAVAGDDAIVVRDAVSA